MGEREDILKEIHSNFEICRTYESQWRMRAKSDLKFFHGDAFNKYQWGGASSLVGSGTPEITINKTAQHVLNIENKARQYKMGINVNPNGYGADILAAEALEGIIRHILQSNNAQQNAIMKAIEGQVRMGMGWIHIRTDYVDAEDSFDQDFIIDPIPDPTNVYSDPSVKQSDHSDMKFAFIVEDMDREEFFAKYPKVGNDVNAGKEYYGDETRDDDVVQLLRYYKKSFKSDTLFAVPNDTGRGYLLVRKSQLAPEVKSAFLEEARVKGYKRRKIFSPYVHFYLVAGNTIINDGETVFKHIPLVPFVGLESVIEGKLDRCGIVRPLRDSQSMLNMAMSSAVESVYLQSKAPFLVEERSIEGLQFDVWNKHNIAQAAFLPFKGTADNGEPLPPPQRLDPPRMSEGHSALMEVSTQHMQGVTGQTDVQMEQAKAVVDTPQAVQAQEKVTLTANYHYTDNQAMALRLLGKILIEAIPYLYDTKRVLRCCLDYGFTQDVTIDPTMQTATNLSDSVPHPTPEQLAKGITSTMPTLRQMQGVKLALNPKVGIYNVVADVGAEYNTTREKAYEGILMLIQTAPALTQVLIPFLLKCSDFPLAQEMYNALQQQPDPQVAELQKQIQQLMQENQMLKLDIRNREGDYALRQRELDLRAKHEEHDRQLGWTDAKTRRMKQSTDAIAAMGSINPEAVKPVLAGQIEQFENELTTPFGLPFADEAPMVDQTIEPEQEIYMNENDNDIGDNELTENSSNENGGMQRLETLNPPGGLIHEPNPVKGAIKE